MTVVQHEAATQPESTTVVRADLPIVAFGSRDPRSDSTGRAMVLLAPRLTFDVVRIALEEKHVVGVVVQSRRFGDHARKMLQEAGKPLVVHNRPLDELADGVRLQIDDHGVINLDDLAVPVTAICSHLTASTVELYRSWNVRDVGYFRHKFCLFRLLAEDPAAYDDPDRIEQYLTGMLRELVAYGWRSVRLVLSDPTSAELREAGVRVASEENPEMGLRGPRAPHRWWPEIKAIRTVLAEAGDTRIQVSVPFVATVAEFATVQRMFAEAGIADRVSLGLTLEVPAMVYALPRLIAECRPAFVAIGTSDLFALLNGVDRSHTALRIDPFSPENRQVVEDICDIAANAGVPFLVCGEIRKDLASARRLADRGTSELLAAASVVEIARMNRAAVAHVR